MFYSPLIVVPSYILVAFAAIGGISPTAELIKRASGVAGSPASVPTWSSFGGLGELGIVEAAGQFAPYGVPLPLSVGFEGSSGGSPRSGRA